MKLLNIFQKKEINWYEKFVQEFSSESNEYFLMIIVTAHSMSPVLYANIDGEVKHSNQLDSTLFQKYKESFLTLKEPGIHIFKYQNKTFTENKLISHYNPELFNPDACELILFQEYGLNPLDEDRKQVLQTSLKAEKIKQTLVYACYLNDTDKILNCLKTCTNAQLNKKLEYCGTPLGLCARNNNLQAFQAIAKKGADLNKISLAERPLEIAFQHSANIVFYIYENHREEFDKEIQKKGFGIACHTKNIELLELLRNEGCDMVCAGANFPPLHNFADYNNVVGIQFLANQGVDLKLQNKLHQTALERARERNNHEAIQLLMQLDKS